MKLKHYAAGLFFLTVTSFKNDTEKNNLSLSISKPLAGTSISFEYKAVNGKLAGAQKVQATLFYFSGNKTSYFAEDLAWDNTGNSWKGAFKLPDSAVAFALRFKSGKDIDDNNGKGYISVVYKNDKPVPGAYAAAAYFYANGSYTLGIANKTDTALSLFEKEFALHSSSKSQWAYTYLYNLVRTRKQAAYPEVDKWVNTILAKKSLSESDYKLVQQLFQLEREKNKADSVLKVGIQKYPSGELAIGDEVNRFYKLSTADSQFLFYKDFIKRFPSADPKSLSGSEASYFLYSISNKYLQKGQYDKAVEYVNLISDDNTIKFSLYNSIASDLLKKDKNLVLADSLSSLALNSVELALNNPAKYKSEGSSLSDWKESLQKNTYSNYADTYAQLLAKKENYAKALEYQQKVYEYSNGERPAYNEHYIEYLSKNNDVSAAQQIAEAFIKEGKATERIKALFKEGYVRQKGTEQGFTDYLASLERIASNKIREEIEKKKINIPAKSFSLPDLSGEQISLASLKGKVVIVDFWATWCGPCKASFPGLQKAINKFKNDKDVVFLLVDTWESVGGEERQKLVSNFIKDNNYTFHVILDNVVDLDKRQYSVVTDYEVDGIPTKFVIDPSGKIKFKEIGFDGNDDKLIEEVSAMVSIAKE